MPAQDSLSGLCRTTLRLGRAEVDVSLPDDVRIAELLPALSELAVKHGAETWTAPLSRYLCTPDLGPIDTSMTLSEAGIRDGALLVLTAAPAEPIRFRGIDPARVIVAEADTVSWTDALSRRTALVAAIGLAALIGALSVPGAGTPRLLLGSAAALTVAVAGVRAAPDSAAVLTPLVNLTALIAAGATAGTVLGLPLADTGPVLAALAITVMALAGRIALWVCDGQAGPPDTLAPRRLRCANQVSMAAAGAAAVGIGLTLTGAPGWPRVAVSATAAAALLTRAWSQRDPACRLVLFGTGFLGIAGVFVALHGTGLALGWLTGLGVLMTLTALRLGFGHPPRSLAALIATLEKAALVATLPAALWALELVRW